MSQPEYLKKGLECCADKDMQWKNCEQCSYGWLGGCSTVLHEDALEYIQYLEEQIPRWISVKERLPEGMGERDQMVNMYTQSRYVLVGFCRRGSWYVIHKSENYGIEACNDEVTHWMPLPEPPEEG